MLYEIERTTGFSDIFRIKFLYLQIPSAIKLRICNFAKIVEMSTIRLKNIKIYAFHGCLLEEGQIGSDYLVNLSVRANLEKGYF